MIRHCPFYVPLLTPLTCLSILQMEEESNGIRINYSNCIDSFLYQVLKKWNGTKLIVHDKAMAISF